MACKIVNITTVVRLPTLEWTRVLLPTRSHCSMAKVNSRDRANSLTLIKTAPCNITSATHLHCMGTWTDKLRRRWQSGSNSCEQDNKEEVKGPSTVIKKSTASNDLSSQHDKHLFRDTKTKSCGSIRDLEIRLEEKEEQLQVQIKATNEYKDKFLRALAETENVRQRMQKQIEEAKLFGTQGFVKDILDVADTLEKATESVPQKDLENNANPPLISLHTGLKLTEAQLQKVLLKNGLTKIDTVGNIFDPKIHEAIFEVPGNKNGTVAVVSRVGYLLNGRTVRAAKVGVVKASQS